MEKKYKKKYRHLFAALLIMILIFCFGMQRMNKAVLRNAQETGDKTARVFALNEVIDMQQVEMALDTMEYQLRPENRTGDVSELIKKYMDFISSTIDVSEMEIYASIDGRIAAATYWEGDETLKPEEKEWYQKALEAGGETAYSGAYTDVRLEKLVVTLSKQIQGTQDVVAVDIYPDSEGSLPGESVVGEDSHYYLCDQDGILLEYNLPGVKREEIQGKFEALFKEIQEGKHDAFDSHIKGIDGIKRGVYYYRLNSGWYSVITIPYKDLMKLSHEFQFFGGIVIAIFFAAILLLLFNDFRIARKASAYNEIVGVLGNSYYALYRIDLEHSQYQMVKASDYVREKISPIGNYDDFLRVIKDVIKEEDFGEFLDTFSVENMRKLMKKRVRDFGGDFRRLFNGEYRWVHIQMLYDESLQKNAVVLCFRDVNDAKMQELSRLEFLKNSLETVDQMSKSRNLFFAQMSHDMRTPLNGIIGLARLAEEQQYDLEQMKETMERISSLGQQLLSLINDTLDITRMEQGKLELHDESFSLKEKLQELTEVFALQARETGKNFRIHVQAEDVWLEGDWGKIQQILNNLLSNAFKFTEKGGHVDLTVTESKDNNSKYRKYSFQVKDDGAGMSQDFLKRIFIPFERDVQFGAAKVAGTGLGMAIVHELIQKLEGTIEVESEMGQGSTFRVTLALRIDEKAAGIEEQAEAAEDHSLEGRRVLLAEDNEINMEIAAQMLEMIGMEVVQAWNGAEAVEIYQEQEEGYFDFILLDMVMPVMDGCQAAEAIRKSGRKDAKTIPVLAATANAFAEDIAKTRKAGMDAHISKPIDFQVLENTMKKLLRRKGEH